MCLLKQRPHIISVSFSAQRWGWVQWLLHWPKYSSWGATWVTTVWLLHPRKSCADTQPLLGHCKELPPNKTALAFRCSSANLTWCVRHEVADRSKNASFGDPKYLAQSHCTATNHLWVLGPTHSYLLWACFFIYRMGLMCLPSVYHEDEMAMFIQ